ncbi:expressed unknown protein [Seminavis robusta]|uniref:Sulfotransferase domain-containing protein n=1 Tax=Seminavis robusta TaxID=568900 RepID=A0A9N8DH87_9STRA|nr:expressed unknown protein [Seminavis robusta]|eukprot:Sro120_g058340.1 n/a (471) ;mRNA; f:22284-23787
MMIAEPEPTRPKAESPRPSSSSFQLRWCVGLSVFVIYVWSETMNSSIYTYQRWFKESNASLHLHIIDNTTTSTSIDLRNSVVEAASSEIKKSKSTDETPRENKSYNMGKKKSNATMIEANNGVKNKTVPQLIWLLSFPNSGTTYTNKLVQGMSGTSTATNYGQEQSGYKSSIPLSPNLPNGPFLRYPDGNTSKYLLTKSHCTGYCIRCSPDRYVLNAERFESGCRSGNHLVNGESVSSKPAYAAELVKKVVHIIRNPFDNIVARLHMQRKNWVNHGDHEEYLKLFVNNRTGFRRWCTFLAYTQVNQTAKAKQLDNFTKQLYAVSPCAAEFYRYTQWHNYAIEAAKDKPVHTLFYENYTENFNQTANELLDFLELDVVGGPEESFQPGKQYPEYFTEDEQYFIANLVRHLATNETWGLLKHYFDGILEDDELDSEEDVEAPEETEEQTDEFDKLGDDEDAEEEDSTVDKSI